MCFWILKLKVNNQIHICNITEQEEHGDSGVTYWNSVLLRVIALFILKYDLFQVWREVLQVAHVGSWAHCQPLQWKYNIRNILTALFKTQHQHWIKFHSVSVNIAAHALQFNWPPHKASRCKGCQVTTGNNFDCHKRNRGFIFNKMTFLCTHTLLTTRSQEQQGLLQPYFTFVQMLNSWHFYMTSTFKLCSLSRSSVLLGVANIEPQVFIAVSKL